MADTSEFKARFDDPIKLGLIRFFGGEMVRDCAVEGQAVSNATERMQPSAECNR
jgi:hypothetical protein